MNARKADKPADPGVPEALQQTLDVVHRRIGAERLDKLWLFPPLVQGRKERGLLVASCFEDGDRRLVHTVTYQAERNGKGLSVETEIFEEGVVPEDRIPRLIRGVVRRSASQMGAPRDVRIGGDHDEFEKLVEEVTPPAFEEVV